MVACFTGPIHFLGYRMITFVAAVVCVGLVPGLPQAPEVMVSLGQAPTALYMPTLPTGAQRYNPFPRYTQSIFILNADGKRMDTVERVRVTGPKWCNPGGLGVAAVKVGSWRSEKYKLVPTSADSGSGSSVKYWIERVPVKNSAGVTQHHIALRRSYPDGTRFDEVLRNTETGAVFEHRIRRKVDGKWKSSVVFTSADSRPAGYTGLNGESCASCHEQTGTGKYAQGLVPGGDTVISDPMDFTQFKRYPAVNYRPEPYPSSALETVQASATEPLELRRLIQRIRQRIRPSTSPAIAMAPEPAMGWAMPSEGGMWPSTPAQGFMGYPGGMQPYAQPFFGYPSPSLPQAPPLRGGIQSMGGFQPQPFRSTFQPTFQSMRGSYYSPGNRGGVFGSGSCPPSGCGAF